MVSKKVSDSVSKNSGIKNSIGIGIGNNLVSKKVSDLVSEKIGIGKKFWIRFRSDFWYRHTLFKTMVIKTFTNINYPQTVRQKRT